MTVSLCDRFPALDPFRVRRETYHEVILLFGRLLGQAKKPKDANGKRLEDGAIKITKKNGDVIIMRPAKNDEHW